jgi:hypothetical protein
MQAFLSKVVYLWNSSLRMRNKRKRKATQGIGEWNTDCSLLGYGMNDIHLEAGVLRLFSAPMYNLRDDI